MRLLIFSSSVCPNLRFTKIDFFRKMVENLRFAVFLPPVTNHHFFQIVPTMKVSALIFAAAGFATASAVELTPDVSYTSPVLFSLGIRYPVDHRCFATLRGNQPITIAETKYDPAANAAEQHTQLSDNELHVEAAQPKIRHGFPPTAGSYGSMRREIRGVSEPWEVICAVGLRPHRIRRRRSRPTNNDQRLPVSQSTIINALIHTILTTLVPILFLSTFVFSLDSRPMRRIGKPKPPARPFWSSS